MKINRLETHDRHKHFIKDQSANISQGVEDCLKKNPLSLSIQDRSPYVYIFAHPRTDDDGVTKRMLWQPRLSIPPAQTNSYLFRAKSKTDLVEVIWMIPAIEYWDQYKSGNVTESNICSWSIDQYKTNRNGLEKPHPEDLPEERARLIMKQILDEKLQQLRMQKYASKPETEELFPTSY